MISTEPTKGDLKPYMHALHQDPCAYCGEPMKHIDHIQPKARGGKNHWTNYTAACFWCNIEKQNASLLGFLAHHRELPEPPNPLATYVVKGPWRYVGDRRPPNG